MNITRLPFNVEMLNALRDGRKGQTRRPLKLKKGWTLKSLEITDSPHPHAKRQRRGCLAQQVTKQFPMIQEQLITAPCLPGDLVYVSEPYAMLHRGTFEPIPYHDSDVREVRYKADERPDVANACASVRGFPWNQANYMPRELSRLTLKIKHVWVEYLTDISPSDAIAEGVSKHSLDPVADFRQMWGEIYGEDNWRANPPVWRIEFEVIHQNINRYIETICAQKKIDYNQLTYV